MGIMETRKKHKIRTYQTWFYWVCTWEITYKVCINVPDSLFGENCDQLPMPNEVTTEKQYYNCPNMAIITSWNNGFYRLTIFEKRSTMCFPGYTYYWWVQRASKRYKSGTRCICTLQRPSIQERNGHRHSYTQSGSSMRISGRYVLLSTILAVLLRLSLKLVCSTNFWSS